ncbi:MAG: tRNA (guanosine(37)-N1)-methyltransferase TrmD [Peptococcaceae bacterium]|jgi:tRNA (guanine37-N1)-methyltransferase|nr:tRNA (guanosine(37)-N1)-methyltransferase TrmD [Peptococcaceae bacterium]
MKFTVLTIFPEMFVPIQKSILKRAQESGLIEIELVNFRDFALSKHKNVDDVPYGGGAGMVLKPEPIFNAMASVEKTGNCRTILLSPQGQLYNQKIVHRLSCYDHLILLCGHYEGFDERIRSLADEELSIGDFVLTGGELAAMVVIDSVARLLPGVLGKANSWEHDSHSQGLLEYPQYTRPPDYEGMKVPEVLLSGHHAEIEKWRRKESLRRTFMRRRDLFAEIEFQQGDYEILEELWPECPGLIDYRPKWEHLKPKAKRKKRKHLSGE